MRTPKSRLLSNGAHAKRLEHLAAAFAAFRRANGRGRWIPRGLRTQAVAALDAGVSANAIRKACGLSSSQLTCWRRAAAASTTVTPPRVLSVVEPTPRSVATDADTSIELRIGPWRINLSLASSASTATSC